jgi:hypothetical protein
MPVIGKIGIGQVGGLTQKVFGENPISTWMRNAGGQLSGGQRSFNLVKPVGAAEVQQNPITGSAARYNMGANSQNDVLGLNNYSGNNNKIITDDGKTGGNGNNGSGYPTQNKIGDVNTGAGEDADIVSQEYDQAISALAGEEQWQQGVAGTQIAGLQGQETAGTNRLSEGKASEMAAAGQQEQTARTEESSGLRSMRDLFRQIQQQNIIDLSGRGISSSSVAEALAEKLGTETMRRIGDITQGTQNVINNIAAEKKRITQVYQSKVQELQAEVKNKIDTVNANLTYALSQISAQRGLAALQKQKGLRDIAQTAREMIDSIKDKAWSYEQTLAAEAQKRQQATDDAIQLLKFNENTGAYELNPMVQSATSSLQQGFPGLGVAPQVQNYNGQPYVQGYSTYQKTKEQNPYPPESPDYMKWEIMNSQ